MRVLLLVLPTLTLLASVATAQKVSPFTMVRWPDETPEVRVEETWYRIAEIAGFDLADVLTHCRAEHGSKWDKRFCEDLPQVLAEMGWTPSSDVDLVLREIESDRVVRLEAVPMTAENRQRILKAEPRAASTRERRDRRGRRAAARRVRRAHATEVADDLHHLSRRYIGVSPGPALSAAEAQDDLDQLEWLIRHRFSYRDLRGVDVPAVFDAIRLGLGDGVAVADFHIQLRKAVALFGDGHSQRPRCLLRAADRGSARRLDRHRRAGRGVDAGRPPGHRPPLADRPRRRPHQRRRPGRRPPRGPRLAPALAS